MSADDFSDQNSRTRVRSFSNVRGEGSLRCVPAVGVGELYLSAAGVSLRIEDVLGLVRSYSSFGLGAHEADIRSACLAMLRRIGARFCIAIALTVRSR